MKKSVLLLMVMVAMVTLAGAQEVIRKRKKNVIKEAEVPVEIVSRLKSVYPTAEDLKWKTEFELYEAEFEVENKKVSVLFDANGKVIETKSEIKIFEVPQSAQDYVNVTYPGKKINEASRVVAANGTVTYEAEVKGIVLVFDGSGRFIREILE